MQVFVRDARTMIAAAVQRDVDGIAKRTHAGRLLEHDGVEHPDQAEEKNDTDEEHTHGRDRDENRADEESTRGSPPPSPALVDAALLARLLGRDHRSKIRRRCGSREMRDSLTSTSVT